MVECLDETIADCQAIYHVDITGLAAHEAARLVAALPRLWPVIPTDREPIVLSAAYAAAKARSRDVAGEQVMDTVDLAAAGITIREVC